MPFSGYQSLPPVVGPLGDQQSHFAQLDDAWLNACEHASEQKIQERFRERYRDYRDRYILPLPPGGVLKTR
jgi:hypothetical protein